ncbi:MAG: hypothetical protein HOD92_01865 [Deltaproteobacteria bacterium]|jgi:hypothetical protein|nr:hypothetical protein [Deltaproteobacteria bacterium]
MSNETILLPIENIKSSTEELYRKKQSLEMNPLYSELVTIVENKQLSIDSEQSSLSPQIQEIIESDLLNELSEYQRQYNSLLTRMIQRRKISSKLNKLPIFVEIKRFAYRIGDLLIAVNTNVHQYSALQFNFDENELNIKSSAENQKSSEDGIIGDLQTAERVRNATVQSFWDQVLDLQTFFQWVASSRDDEVTKNLINNNLNKFVKALEIEFEDLFVVKDCMAQLGGNLKVLMGYYQHDNVPGKEKLDYCEEGCNFYSLDFDPSSNLVRLVQDQHKKIFIRKKEFLLLLNDFRRINHKIGKDLITKAKKMVFEKESKEFPAAIWYQLMKVDISQLASFELVSQNLLKDRSKKDLGLIISVYEDILDRLNTIYEQVQEELNQRKVANENSFSLFINEAEYKLFYEINPETPKGFRRVSAHAVRRLVMRYKKFWQESKNKLRIVQINSQQLMALMTSIHHHKNEISDQVNELIFVEDDAFSPFIYWAKNTFQKIIESRVPDDIITPDKLDIVYEIMTKIVIAYNAGKRLQSDVIKDYPLSMNVSKKDVKRGTVYLNKATESLLVALSELAILGNQTLFKPSSNIMLPAK